MMTLSIKHNRNSARLLALAIMLAIFAAPETSLAADPAPSKKGAAPKANGNKGYRKKELNFEERVIEGLTNKGYESLSQTGSFDGLKGEKLYRKRAEFDEDSKSLLREMEYLK